MKKSFVASWKRSVQPRKQRKYRANAPLHVKRKFLAAHLSKELRQKYKTRNIPLRKGDRVKIVRGTYKNHLGKIDHINTKRERIFIEGTDRIKKDGTKSLYPIHPSNVIIHELILDDKRRKEILERRGAKK
jgi:large subunit ribosomal protein L24